MLSCFSKENNFSKLYVVVAVALFASAHLLLLGGPAFRLDDAYIVLNNSDALLHGDKNFPDARPLLGSTSLIHTLAVTALSVVLSPELALWVSAWASVLVLMLGVLHLCLHLQLSSLTTTLLVVVSVTTGDLFRVHLNGLETGLMMATTLWALVLLHIGTRPVSLAALAAALPFIRPELGLLSLVVMICLWGDLKHDAQNRKLIQIIFILLASFLLSLQVILSGSALPSTGSAKAHFFGLYPFDQALIMHRGIQIISGLAMDGAAIPLLALGMICGRTTLIATGFGVITSCLILGAYSEIADQNYFRYLYFVIPMGLFNLTVALSTPRLQKVGSVFLWAAIAINLVLATFTWPRALQEVRTKAVSLAATARWIDENLHAEDTLMLHDVGFVSFATDQVLFDIVGLKSPYAQTIVEDYAFQKGLPGLQRALSKMVVQSKACYFLASNSWNDTFNMTELLIQDGWRLEPHPSGSPPNHVLFQIVAAEVQPTWE
ncbi:hypothetical protein [Actibacterium pelagium]|uniref:hypothetical protein n=1 Tax=Actibacterium pelagium TaxID=2029103 RepID=UPI000BAAF635|nr:hypothetical protein [Actibacterium pelagium]